MNTKTKALLAFAAIFIVGFASGFLFNNTISPSSGDYVEERPEQVEQAERWQRGGRGEQDQPRVERARERLVNLLELTSEQQVPFFEHMSEYRSGLRTELREMRNRETELVRERYEALREDLSGILNPEQLEKLDSHLHPDSIGDQRWRGRR